MISYGVTAPLTLSDRVSQQFSGDNVSRGSTPFGYQPESVHYNTLLLKYHFISWHDLIHKTLSKDSLFVLEDADEQEQQEVNALDVSFPPGGQ